jgi:hypothetical protein
VHYRTSLSLEPPEREDWRAAASVLNESPECTGAPVFAIASGPDSGDPAYLYGHYLDPALGIRILPVQAGEAFDPATFARVWQSPCVDNEVAGPAGLAPSRSTTLP